MPNYYLHYYAPCILISKYFLSLFIQQDSTVKLSEITITMLLKPTTFYNLINIVNFKCRLFVLTIK